MSAAAPINGIGIVSPETHQLTSHGAFQLRRIHPGISLKRLPKFWIARSPPGVVRAMAMDRIRHPATSQGAWKTNPLPCPPGSIEPTESRR